MEKQYCSSCMEPISGAPCPNCGASETSNRPWQLACGTLLENRYLIGKCLGQGGFGITYIGRDLRLDRIIAVKEYYPISLIRQRNSSSENVEAADEDMRPLFESEKAKFLQEARLLAQFSDDPNIVQVTDYFPENNTAYIVLEYLNGQSLAEILREQGPMDFSRVMALMEPVMDSLENMHKSALLHRDISPANLMLLQSGRVKLLDFGSARQIQLDEEKDVTVFTKAGYTPAEQYDANGEQGPWSDVYSLSATMYKLITGVTPDSALTRAYHDTLKKPSELGAVISPSQEKALLKGLAVQSEDRFRSMAELRSALCQPEEDDELTYWGGTSINADSGTTAAPEERLPHDAGESRHAVAVRPVTIREERNTESSDSAGHNTPKTVASSASGKSPDTKKNKSHRKKRKVLFWAIPVAIAAIIVIIFLFSGLSKDSKTSSMSFYNQTITASHIKSVRRNRTCDTLHFTDCILSDEIIKDISECSRLSQVTFTRCCGFTSLNDLASLNKLTRLSIYGDEHTATDISLALTQDFPVVSTLEVQKEVLSSADFLIHFPMLRNLTIDQCLGSPERMESLSTLSNLWKLSIVGWDLSKAGLPSMSGLTDIRHLCLNYCGLTDISPLADLKNLSHLELSHNSIEDVTPIAGLTDISLLNLNCNPVSDVSVLKDLSGMTALFLDETGIDSLDVCLNMVDLNSISAARNSLSSIDGLTNCSVLRYANLEDNVLTDVSLLQKSVAALYAVRLSRNELTDISFLHGAINLTGITVAENHLTSLDGLQESAELTTVSAYGNEIEDISGLSNCYVLKRVDLGDNRISDVSPLHLSEDMKYILLQNNDISDLSVLDLPVLKSAYAVLYGNPLEKFPVSRSSDASMRTFSSLYITFDEQLDLPLLHDVSFKLYFIDTPMDLRGKINELFFFGPRYLSLDEADEIIDGYRAQIDDAISS